MSHSNWFWQHRQQQQREAVRKQIEQAKRDQYDGPALDECIEQWSYIARYNKEHPDAPLKF